MRPIEPLIIDQPYVDEKPRNLLEAQRPRLSPSVLGSYASHDNLDAQLNWEAHIAAGRITVG